MSILGWFLLLVLVVCNTKLTKSLHEKYDVTHSAAVINHANQLFLNRERSYDFKSIGQGCSSYCSAFFSVGMLDFHAARRW